MAAKDLKPFPEIEAELNPRVVNIANVLDRYAAYAELLTRNDYPCSVLAELPQELPAAGTVFFVSYNLKSADSVQVAKIIERQFKMICIVFAEDEGTQTATKLSSAKMTQTLQYPYSEKNFLMAMQTIVKKRKAQHEKDLRKKQHDERQKAKQKIKEPEAAKSDIDLTFKREASDLTNQGGVIFQRAAEKLIDDNARVFKGESQSSQTLVQKFASTKNFTILQEGPSQKRAAKRAGVVPIKAKARQQDAIATQAPVSQKSTPETHPHAKVAVDSPAADTSLDAQKQDSQFTPAVQEGEYAPSLAWTIVIMCLLGSAICIYCVHQALFT